MIHRRVTLLGSAATIALASCRDAPPGTRFADLTYAHRGQFRLDVGRIENISDYVSSSTPPHVELRAPAVPELVLRNWARDRLVAAGNPERYARFVVLDGRIIETELPRPTGVRGQVTTAQSERYDISMAAALELRMERGNFREGFAEARSQRTRTVAENITLAERDRTLYELIEAMMIDLDAELDRQIRGNLQRFLVG
jgi:hypothetical protein